MTPAKNEKNFGKDVFLIQYFVEILLGCCLHSYIIFYLMFTLRCRHADIVATVSSPVSLLPTIASVVFTGDYLLPVSL